MAATVNNGEDALGKALKNDYSLIILEVHMPAMDGYKVSETFAGHNKTKEIPI